MFLDDVMQQPTFIVAFRFSYLVFEDFRLVLCASERHGAVDLRHDTRYSHNKQQSQRVNINHRHVMLRLQRNINTSNCLN